MDLILQQMEFLVELRVIQPVAFRETEQLKEILLEVNSGGLHQYVPVESRKIFSHG
jgi:hypothetical protein